MTQRTKEALNRAWLEIYEPMKYKCESSQAINIMHACYRMLCEGFSDGMVRELENTIDVYKGVHPFGYRVVYPKLDRSCCEYFHTFNDAMKFYASLMDVAGTASCMPMEEMYKRAKIQEYNSETRTYEEIQ